MGSLLDLALHALTDFPSLPESSDLRSSIFSLEGGLDGLPLRATFSPAHPLARRDVPLAQARAFNSLNLYLGSGQGCPLLRASNEHSFIVRVLRARRAHGRSRPLLCSGSKGSAQVSFEMLVLCGWSENYAWPVLRARSAIFFRRRAFSRLISASLTSEGRPPALRCCSAFSKAA